MDFWANMDVGFEKQGILPRTKTRKKSNGKRKLRLGFRANLLSLHSVRQWPVGERKGRMLAGLVWRDLPPGQRRLMRQARKALSAILNGKPHVVSD